MGRIVVCGGSVIGSCTGAMLARDGHTVTVLEADPDGAPESPADAWASWRRRGVAQFHQPHNLHARFREVCDAELPGLTDRLLAAGCTPVDPLAAQPPTIPDRGPRPGDERLRFVTGRRPVTESVVARAAQETAGLDVRRGVRVAGLLTGPPALPGVPHVTGVRTTDGEELRADLVVDATGRRTRSPGWLAAIGAAPPRLEAEDLGFVYYTRYLSGPERPVRMAPAIVPMGSVSVLTLDGDNGTWSVTVFGMAHDAPLRALRDPAAFDRVVRACPPQAHWLDGRPSDGVLSMGGTLDAHRDLVVDGRPVVTGLALVGDAWACTNPSAGRGLSIGMIQAQLLRAVVAAHLDDPVGLVLALAAGTAAAAEPFYRDQVAADRRRAAEMRALADGTPPPAPDPLATAFTAAAGRDPVLFRALLEMVLCLAPPSEVLARPAIRERLATAGAPAGGPPPGPDRAGLLALLS